ncbi:MAG: radical SAM protein [bacterium]|nr:radical SAM protein [bacterium]
MALELIYKIDTGVDFKKIVPLSQMVERYSGIPVAPNKAIVGHNAFRHESGIHVHAMLKVLKTYETFSPELLGRRHEFVLGKHSGKSLIRKILSLEPREDHQLEKLMLFKVKNNLHNKEEKEKMYREIQDYYTRELGITEEELLNLYFEIREVGDTRDTGEGERLFYKFLEGELPASQRLFTLRDNDGEVDLATLDIPDFSGLDIDAYPYSSGFASRSCPFQCAFCSETVFWGKYRKKDVPKTVAQFERLYERDKTQLFSMSDSLLNTLIDDLADNFMKSKHAIYWDACIRAGDKVGNIENTHQWRRGGFYKAWLGLESGSPRVLKLMNKKISIEQTMNSVSALAHAGIKTATLWLIGFPGETEEDFQQTLDLLEELKDDIYDAEGTPFRYFLKGQSYSGYWEGRTHSLLYPGSAREMLMVQTWILNGEPSREVTYQRLNRFIQHLNKLGIPNPYTLRDMYRADERWKRLQKNAVPSILEFSGDAYIDECKRIEKYSFVPKPRNYDGDFGL